MKQLSDEQIDILQEQYDCFGNCDAPRIHDLVRAAIAADRALNGIGEAQPWVGLTAEDMAQFAAKWRGRNWTFGDIVNDTEAKLREKNAAQPAADDKPDEPALQRLTQNGAVAWAGVDPQELREGRVADDKAGVEPVAWINELGRVSQFPSMPITDQNWKPLYTTPPAPAVPEGYALDAARYRWLRNKAMGDDGVPFICVLSNGYTGQLDCEAADEAIDRAMLSAAP